MKRQIEKPRYVISILFYGHHNGTRDRGRIINSPRKPVRYCKWRFGRLIWMFKISNPIQIYKNGGGYLKFTERNKFGKLTNYK